MITESSLATQEVEKECLEKPPTATVNQVILEAQAKSPSTSLQVPLQYRLFIVTLLVAIGFGSSWSTGITGAMKTTLKKELHIDNTKYSLLVASEDIIVATLIVFSGLWTDRVGGASAILYGNGLYTLGSILIAAACQIRSFKLMIFGEVVESIGDISIQVAQYQTLSAWFPSNNGFASTVAIEVSLRKIGAFVGKSSANIISKHLGFTWVYWIAVLVNVATNLLTLGFWLFNGYIRKKFVDQAGSIISKELERKTHRFDYRVLCKLPWSFWVLVLYSFFETSTGIIFTNNATEFAEQRLHTSSIDAGWYSSLVEYAGFFLTPFIGIFIDIWGHRVTMLVVCGIGTLLSMALVNWATSVRGTGTAFGIYAVILSFNPTLLIDCVQASIWDPSTFGTAYACKLAMNYSVDIVIAIICGVIQDADGGTYDRVTIVYLVDAFMSVIVSGFLIVLCCTSLEIRHLQWSRKKRNACAAVLDDRRRESLERARWYHTLIPRLSFFMLVLLIIGAWVAFIWGAITGNNA